MEIKELHQLFLNSTGISTDTRKIEKNQLFFCLKGENFNGNLYAEEALKKGAKYVVADEKHFDHQNTILVDNSLKALQKLASFHRTHLKTPILSLTGSNGKTTTKELINAVLSKKFNTKATIGNLNNHIGVPLTLLTFNENTEFGIVEMGANHMKEIDLLSKISQPNYGYITNIGKAHLEGFGSEENILKGKTELYDYLKENNGSIFLNTEDDKLTTKADGLNNITFSTNENSDYTIKLTNCNPMVEVRFNDTPIKSNLIGSYNFTNIAAAITIGAHFNITTHLIKEAIEDYVPTMNRSQIIKKGTNQIILDAYNANPSSMIVAVENIENLNNNLKKTVIIGDMFELGTYANQEHQKIVEELSKEESTIESAIIVGEKFYETKVTTKKIQKFANTEDVTNYLKNNKIENNNILIKGSRGMKLEKILEYL